MKTSQDIDQGVGCAVIMIGFAIAVGSIIYFVRTPSELKHSIVPKFTNMTVRVSERIRLLEERMDVKDREIENRIDVLSEIEEQRIRNGRVSVLPKITKPKWIGLPTQEWIEFKDVENPGRGE